jgi:hypothetical protein
MYFEFGCPFDNGIPTDFKLQLSIKAGGPYWGGAGVSYAPIEVSGKTGEMRIRAPGSGGITFEKGPQFGLDGVPQTVSFALGTIKARMREDLSSNEFAITTNDASIGQAAGATLVQDRPNAASWRLSMFGFDDAFKIQRAAPGASTRAGYADLLKINAAGEVITTSQMIGQASKAAGSNGQLAVTATAGAVSPLTAKGGGIDTAPVAILWNPATSGNNLLATFATEASYTPRGAISYNRTSAVITYGTTSDRRAKDIHGEIEDAVERLMDIKTYRGRMRGAEADMDLVIADELAEVAPYAVTGEPNAVHDAIVDYAEDGEPIVASVPHYQQVDLAKLVPLLISGFQRQEARIQDLVAANDNLSERLAALEAA